MLHTLLAQPGLSTVQGARPQILITIGLAALLGLPPDHPAAAITLADLAAWLGIDLPDLTDTDPDAGPDADADADTADTHGAFGTGGPQRGAEGEPGTTDGAGADGAGADAPGADPEAGADAPGADAEGGADAPGADASGADAEAGTGKVDAGEADAGEATTGAPGQPTGPAQGASGASSGADPPVPAPPPPARPPPRRPPRVGSGMPVSPTTVRGLVPAATIMAVLTLGPWRAVNVGAKHRTLPAWLRTVLAAFHVHHTTGNVTWTSPTGRVIVVPPPSPWPFG